MMPHRSYAYILAVALACLTTAPGPVSAEFQNENTSLLRPTAAEFLYSGAPEDGDRVQTPPSSQQHLWSSVGVPHFWPLENQGELAIGWYRLSFEQPDDWPSELGVYLPQYESNASVFINQSWIGDAGPPGSLNWNQPAYFPFPSTLLQSGTNTIEVRLEAYGTPGAGLSSIEIGPNQLLRPRWQRQWWFRVGATEIGTVLAVLSALLFGAVWLGKSRDSVYGWCSLAAMSWGINSLNYHVQVPPVTYWAWKWLVHAGLDLFALTFAFLVLRMIDVRMPRTERAMMLFTGLAVSVPILAPREYFFSLANCFHGGSLLFGLTAAIWLVRGRSRLQPYEFGVFLFLGFFFNALLVRDYAIQVGWLPNESARLFHLTAPMLFSAFAITLLVRFIVTYRNAERTNIILEQRVKEKETELERHFSRLGELEQLQAVSHERERIMREMHDGMGGHLVSALSMVEEADEDSSEVAGELRRSLDEMRLVIYSLDSAAHDITSALATLRERLEPRLRLAGVIFQWQVTDLPLVNRFGPEQYLHILRIFQEAITNALKHSGAQEICITTGVETGAQGREHIFIRVSDDGRGMSTSAKKGYGIQNMTFRAKALGGALDVRSSSPGTRVELRFPIDLD